MSRLPQRRLRGIGAFALICLGCVAISPSLLAFGEGVEGFRFVIPSIDARPGERIDLEVQGLHEVSVQGFSFSASFPTDAFRIDRIHHEDTILESLRVDFFEASVDEVGGVITVGALVDTSPPFDGQLIPNIGCELTLFHIEATVDENASGEQVLRTGDDLQVPPILNGYSVADQFAFLSEPAVGLVRLPSPQRAAFLRGDANQDGAVDVSDPVAVLEYRFLGGRTPGCMDAADANDDERVGLSDAVFLLAHLFQGGSPPPNPYSAVGIDPDGFDLDCVEPLVWLEP